MTLDLSRLPDVLAAIPVSYGYGEVTRIAPGSIKVSGFRPGGRIGESLCIRDGIAAEIVALGPGGATAMVHGSTEGLAIGDPVRREGDPSLRPCVGWLGRVIDGFGRPLDGPSLPVGAEPVPLRRSPPPAMARRGWGARLSTGQLTFDTFLPVVRGQRMGLFAGSGVGKTTLIGRFARQLDADVVVIALIG